MARNWRCMWSMDVEGKNPIKDLRYGMVEEGTTQQRTLYLHNLEEFPVIAVTLEHVNKDVRIRPYTFSRIEEGGYVSVQFDWIVSNKSVALKDVLKVSARLVKES